jgi:hypothetical protein
MEALSAVGLVGNVITFIEFSHKLFSSTRKIYSSTSEAGSDGDSVQLLAARLKNIAQDLQGSSTALASKGPTRWSNLLIVAKTCEDDAAELLAVLKDLAPEDKSSVWDSFVSALMLEWRKEKLDEMRWRLDSARVQMSIELHVLSLYCFPPSLPQLLSNHFPKRRTWRQR